MATASPRRALPLSPRAPRRRGAAALGLIAALAACGGLDSGPSRTLLDPTRPIDVPGGPPVPPPPPPLSPPRCEAAPAIDPARSLLVSDHAVLHAPAAGFSLGRVLGQLAAESREPGLTAAGLFARLWATQGPGGCDQERALDGGPGLNGFPLQCGRVEAQQARDPAAYLASYRAIALSNRFDLASRDGQSCGEFRIVFAKDPGYGPGRNFLIFEASLPNPQPACGLSACRPVAEFWAQLSQRDDPADRAVRLARFYFQGLPGFRPVIHPEHFGARGGQIRTNQFMEGPWTLRELRLIPECRGACALRVAPTAVAATPYPGLWEAGLPGPFADHARELQESVVAQAGSLAAAGEVLGLGLSVPPRALAAESPVPDASEALAAFQRGGRGAGSLYDRLGQALWQARSPLTPDHLFRRAQTQTCAGCHQHSNAWADLGGGLRWRPSLGFVHVSEQQVQQGPDGPRYAISPALREVFLPQRQRILADFLGACATCDSGGAYAVGSRQQALSAPTARLNPSGSAH